MFDNLLLNISRKSREQKYKDFLRLLSIAPSDEIIDVGFHDHEYRSVDNYLEKHYPYPERLTALGIEGSDEFQKNYPSVRAVVYDGTTMPFANKHFNALHSNAVLEHVGSSAQQVYFLQECNRISENVFLTVPNGRFPVEVHTHMPLLHFLPKKLFDWFLKLIGKSWAAGSFMSLLSKRDIVETLDKAGIMRYTVLSNSFLGIPLTYTIVWGERIHEASSVDN